MANTKLRDWMVGPGGLSTRLRKARADAGLSAKALADRLEWPDYRVSKIENGRQIPTEADVEAWADACEADEATREALNDTLARALANHQEWKGRATTTAVSSQYADLVAATTEFHLFEPDLIPGLLQTPDYCLAIQSSLAAEVESTPEDTAGKVRIRMEAARALYDQGKTFRVIIGEAALHYWPADGATMRAQLGHLAVVAGLPNVDLAVTPFDVTLSTLPYNAFALYDGLAIVETRSEEAIYQPTERRAKLYAEVWPNLWAQSLTGEAARSRIQSTANAITPEEVRP